MNRLLAVTSLILVLAPTAPSAAGEEHVGLFADRTGTSCYLAADSGVVTVYVVHANRVGRDGSRGVAFRVTGGGGFDGVWVGDTIAHGAGAGDSQRGLAITYPECELGTAVIAAVTYRLERRPLPCSYIEVVPVAQTPSALARLVADDCGGRTYAAVGGRLYFNDEGSCLCGLAHINGEQWKHDRFRAGPPEDVRFEFEGAAIEFNIPAGVLEAVGFVRTRWSRKADDERSGRRGLMGIPQAGLADGADAIGESVDDVVARVDANVRAAAALLRAYLDEAGVTVTVDDRAIDGAAWAGVLQRYLGGESPDELLDVIAKTGLTVR